MQPPHLPSANTCPVSLLRLNKTLQASAVHKNVILASKLLPLSVVIPRIQIPTHPCPTHHSKRSWSMTMKCLIGRSQSIRHQYSTKRSSPDAMTRPSLRDRADRRPLLRRLPRTQAHPLCPSDPARAGHPAAAQSRRTTPRSRSERSTHTSLTKPDRTPTSSGRGCCGCGWRAGRSGSGSWRSRALCWLRGRGDTPAHRLFFEALSLLKAALLQRLSFWAADAS